MLSLKIMQLAPHVEHVINERFKIKSIHSPMQKLVFHVLHLCAKEPFLCTILNPMGKLGDEKVDLTNRKS